jgi:Mlc titration factor MtfA (ptsG expression regulator)
MILSWWRRRRRARVLAEPFPGEWEEIIRRNVSQFADLMEADQERLRRWVQVFVAEKYWEGCRGQEMTDEVKVTIAAQAGRLVLGIENEYFERVMTVLVYPSDYYAQERRPGPAGTVIEGPDHRLGEAWHQGPVILSWPSVLAGGRRRNRGQNVVLHEFAHVLDMMDHGIDGVPPLDSAEQYRTWEEVMRAEYERLVRRAEQGRPTLLDHYGAVNEAEFFAVATECFFEQPVEMAERHPQLYEVLGGFYRQDPRGRLVAG